GLFLLLAAGSQPLVAQTPGDLWTDVDPATLGAPSDFEVPPFQFRALALDRAALFDLLRQAPRTRTPRPGQGVVLWLPLPDGGFGRFRAVESPTMAPGLEARFPQIKTYGARGVDDPAATARLAWTPKGFHAMILSPTGTVYLDPYRRGDAVHHLVYAKRDARRASIPPRAEPLDENGMREQIATLVAQGVGPTGEQLRTYRVAIAATGEYTQFHGGTVADGLAAIVVALDRVNGLYERDVAVFMELVANNDLVVFTDPATDPYTNSSGGTMLGQNQATLDAIIGSANYDVGHVFSTGGGGVAFLGVVCTAGLKARGVTGLSNPIGDPFYVDYVAHELGHQYGANHTFNGNAGSCGSNRNASTAYEPGSGTTIMAYAGICGNQNIQPNSDDHFHHASFAEIVAYTTSGGGNACPSITNTGNTPPAVSVPPGGFTIPIETPFSLLGSATDPDGDALTYNWEQYDLGPAGAPNNPVGNAPLFRSFPSMDVPERLFPQVSDLLGNTQTLGEILPTYTRGLTFRLTVRDNQIGAGGVGFAEMSFGVTDAAGPFLVTGPNTLVTWTVGAQETVTWDVAGTSAAPVGAQTVNLRLSTDGGLSFPIALATGVPNDGSETITVPDVPETTTARVKVEAADHVFFDLSDADFTITGGTAPAFALTLKKVFLKTNGVGVAKVKWNPLEVTTGKLDFYIDEAPDGTPFNRTGNDGKHKLKFADPSAGPFAIQACEKKSTTVCSNVVVADFTGAVVEDDDEPDAEADSPPYGGRVADGGMHAPASVTALPEAFALQGNYPNPFNPATQIRFDLPEDAAVSVQVVDLLGRRVLEVPAQALAAGAGRSVEIDGSALASGVYLYRLIARTATGVQVATGRMTLLK
ncbi:MAG: M12 family metallo-peptidase, partial [Rhodothermales bacterium]|nr:M12 family metallo-peptidase [Rhodothermales bacterium]